MLMKTAAVRAADQRENRHSELTSTTTVENAAWVGRRTTDAVENVEGRVAYPPRNSSPALTRSGGPDASSERVGPDQVS